MNDDVFLDVVHLDDHSVVIVVGEIDMASAPTLQAAITPLLSTGQPLVLDLEGVTFMDSSGLNVLARTAAALRETGSVRVRNPSPQVRRLITISGIDQVVSVDDGVTAASATTRADARPTSLEQADC